jgi:hypothetical protein
LGHASVGFTLTVYSHALPGYDREAADAMAALIPGTDAKPAPASEDLEGEVVGEEETDGARMDGAPDEVR